MAGKLGAGDRGAARHEGIDDGRVLRYRGRPGPGLGHVYPPVSLGVIRKVGGQAADTVSSVAAEQ